ncbi:CDF-like metal transporter [Meredithblackwellia eburnea MCA 4105]
MSHPLAPQPSPPILNEAATGHDLEAPPSHTTEQDPLLLRSKLHPEEGITALRNRGGKGKKLGGFYESQNAQIEDLLKSFDQHVEEAKEDDMKNRLPIKIAVYGSLICNCILATLQLYAAVSSLSLSFFATGKVPFFSNFWEILNWCHRQGKKADRNKYPSGGSRFETVGDVTYSFAMLMVSVILICFSIQQLATKDDEGDGKLHIPAIIAVSIAFVTKFILFLYCYSIRGKDSQVGVLWEDHRNDLFVNGFGIFTNAAGAKIKWWIDPMGALIISVGLVIVWSITAYGHFQKLVGRAAPREFQQLLVYKAMTFSEEIECIENCLAYHSGSNYIVEIDIVMKGDTPLWVAHDVSQALQDKIEALPQVERAFVHVDHEVSHKPEHHRYD